MAIYSLDTAALAATWDGVMTSYIDVHSAQTEQEKSQALRLHAYAIMEHINTLDAIVPDLDSMSATALPTQGATHSTGSITQDYTPLHTTISTTIPL